MVIGIIKDSAVVKIVFIVVNESGFVFIIGIHVFKQMSQELLLSIYL